jgi:adenylate cyclase, class 2
MAGADHQEIEVKFYLNSLAALETRLLALGAQVKQARVYEANIRFDTPGGDLTRASRVLRLRQDTAARLTYKGPGQTRDGVRVRQEIEFTVSDFAAARDFLEALGYEVSMMYEKYRATYQLGEVLVTLDEMPYGPFAEIEGPSPEAVKAASDKLGLDFAAGVAESYSVLFEHLRDVLGFQFRDLSFKNFTGTLVTPVNLGVSPADAA